MERVLVLEAPSLDPDAQADARAVAERLGGVVVAPADALALIRGGETVLADVWSSDRDDAIVQLRHAGASVRCLADVLLERAGRRVVAVTGTAGKTTTTSMLAQLLEGVLGDAGVGVGAARAGNCWPSADLLDAPESALLVLELTSSHLSFCSHPARVAAITSFWPDHVELHGSVAAYAAAKRSLFAAQDETCIAVVPSDDEHARLLVEGAGAARRAWWSTDASASTTTGPVACWVAGGLLHARDDAGRALEVPLELLPAWTRSGPSLRNIACAVAAAVASHGAVDERLATACIRLARPPHRGTRLDVDVDGRTVRLVDATLAATPRKAQVLLQEGDVVVCGGLSTVAGRRVHGDPAERDALDAWCVDLGRRAAAIVTFGDAGRALAAMLDRRIDRAGIEHRESIEAAVDLALAVAAASGSRVLVAPGHPLDQSARAWVAGRGSAQPT
jgi:UDP-N-acetylmuramoylalanine--D-glutamate ligase